MVRSDEEAFAAAIGLLEHVRRHLGMYMCPQEADVAIAFLNGIGFGLSASGVHYDHWDDWWSVQAARGWKMHPCGPVPQMREKGMDEIAVINELIDIELDLLRRHSSRSNPQGM